jgi:hypothetical protein
MTRAPLLCPLVGCADDGSSFTVLGVDADERDADLDADPDDTDLNDTDPDERDAIRRGIHELPWQRDREGGGIIPRTGEVATLDVREHGFEGTARLLHQRRQPAALLHAGGGGGPS